MKINPALKLAATAVAVLLAGCSHLAAGDVRSVSVADLEAHPEAFAGKPVQVRGYMSVVYGQIVLEDAEAGCSPPESGGVMLVTRLPLSQYVRAPDGVREDPGRLVEMSGVFEPSEEPWNLRDGEPPAQWRGIGPLTHARLLTVTEARC